MATQNASIPTEGTAPAERLHVASANTRYGRAAVFAAGFCVLGMLMLLVGQLGWWALIAAPAYLAAAALTAMVARGRTQALLAVAISTTSMGVIVALVKVAGLA